MRVQVCSCESICLFDGLYIAIKTRVVQRVDNLAIDRAGCNTEINEVIRKRLSPPHVLLPNMTEPFIECCRMRSCRFVEKQRQHVAFAHMFFEQGFERGYMRRTCDAVAFSPDADKIGNGLLQSPDGYVFQELLNGGIVLPTDE